jgi:ATP-dependent Clp protease ATP-binding subunit ClpA
MTFITTKLKELNERQESLPPSNNGLVTRFRFDPAKVMEHARTKILGQEETLNRLEDMLNIIWSDIGEPDRPLYTALFLGPTGVGKTEMVRAISEAIHGSPEEFCRIDMNTLTQEHYSAAITGAPPGYVGSKEGKSIFQVDKIEGSFSKPGIVLFDELEKADDDVIYSLLNVLDNGLLTMTSGEKTIDFRNAIIFMTSNIGAREIIECADGNVKSSVRRWLWLLRPSNWGKKEEDYLRDITMKQLEKRFSPELINRLDDICVFGWLNQEVLQNILDLNIQALNQRIAKHNIKIILNDSVRMFLLKEGFNKKYGARHLKRTIRKHIEAPLASELRKRLQEEAPVVFTCDITNGRIVLTSDKKPDLDQNKSLSDTASRQSPNDEGG